MTKPYLDISEDSVICVLSVDCSKCNAKEFDWKLTQEEFIKNLKNKGWVGDKNKQPICPNCKKTITNKL